MDCPFNYFKENKEGNNTNKSKTYGEVRPLLLGLVALVGEGGGKVSRDHLVANKDDMERLELRQPERDDLPANQVTDLGNARAHQVDGEAGERVDGLTAYGTGLLGRVEYGERTGVEKGEVAQFTLLVTCVKYRQVEKMSHPVV